MKSKYITQKKYNAIAKELALYKEKEKAWLDTYEKMKNTSLKAETYVMLQTLAAGSIAYRLAGNVLNSEAIKYRTILNRVILIYDKYKIDNTIYINANLEHEFISEVVTLMLDTKKILGSK
jgi:hypothetical protein